MQGKRKSGNSWGISTQSKNSQCTLLGLSLRNRLESCNMPEILKTEKKEEVRAQIQVPGAMVQSREGCEQDNGKIWSFTAPPPQ